MNDNKQALYDLIPAYALDALDPEERAAVESQLDTDPEAQRLLAEYRQVAELLVYTAPARPAPPQLADDLRRRLAAQHPRPTRTAAPARRRQYRALWLAAAVVTLAAAAALLLRPALMPPAPDPAQAFATLTASQNVLHIPIAPGEGQEVVTGELVAAPDGTLAVIRVESLPALSPDQTFQLWMREADGDVYSGGLFRAAPGDVAYIPVPLEGRPLDSFVGFGVSIEPAGGSPYPDRPTGPRVFAVTVDL